MISCTADKQIVMSSDPRCEDWGICVCTARTAEAGIGCLPWGYYHS
jgi:hypothetical protein